jgi:hypothetical protein
MELKAAGIGLKEARTLGKLNLNMIIITITQVFATISVEPTKAKKVLT